MSWDPHFLPMIKAPSSLVLRCRLGAAALQGLSGPAGAPGGRASVQLAVHGVQQGHVLRPLEGQLLVGVIVYHFRDAVEHRAHLVQRVLVVFGLGHDDVDTALTGPGQTETEAETRTHE